MRSTRTVLCALAVLVTTACSQQDSASVNPPQAAPPATPAVTPTASEGSLLATALDSANIGRRLDIFERKIGAPTDARKDWASYTVEECTLHVETEENVIRWIEIQLGFGDCRVDLKPLLGESLTVSKASPLTFSQFDTFSSKHTFYTYPCPGLDCGNALEPSFIVVSPGVHAGNWIDMAATSWMSDGYDTYFAWKEAIHQIAGDDAYNVNLECDRQFDELSRRMLASVTVDAIGFGHREASFPCD